MGITAITAKFTDTPGTLLPKGSLWSPLSPLQAGLKFSVPENTFIGREFLTNADQSAGPSGWYLGTDAFVRQQGWVATMSASSSSGVRFAHISDSISHRIPLAASTAITLWGIHRAQVGTQGSFDLVRIRYYDDLDVLISEDALNISTFSTSWGTSSSSVVSPAGTASFGVVISETSLTAGVVYLGAIGVRLANTELLPDPDFSILSHWTKYGTTTTLGANASNAYMENSPDGTQRYVLQVRKGSLGPTYNLKQFPCLVGEEFEFTVQVKPGSASPSLPYVLWFSASDTSTPISSTALTFSGYSAGSWSTISARATAPEGASLGRLVLSSGNPSAIDDFFGTASVCPVKDGTLTPETQGEATLTIEGVDTFSQNSATLGMVLRSTVPSLFGVYCEVTFLIYGDTVSETSPTTVLHKLVPSDSYDVEYDEYLNPVRGIQALPLRAAHRIDLRLGEIAYYDQGVPEDLFSLDGFAIGTLRRVLGDIDPNLVIDTSRGRVVLSNLKLSVSVSQQGLALGKV